MTDAWEPRVEQLPERPPKTGFPVGLTIAAVIGFSILIGLGAWQLQRLKWKENLLSHVAALLVARPQSLGWTLENPLARGQDVDLTRVSVVCPGLATAPALEVYDLRNGQAGSRLVSACAIQAGPFRSILVDRGYISDSTTRRPSVNAADRTPMEIVGVLRKPERGNLFSPKNTPDHWYIRNVAAMAAALGAPQPAPLILFAETSTNPDFPALTPAPLPVDIPNRHFEYALTWFGLAGALAFVYAATLFRRMKG